MAWMITSAEPETVPAPQLAFVTDTNEYEVLIAGVTVIVTGDATKPVNEKLLLPSVYTKSHGPAPVKLTLKLVDSPWHTVASPDSVAVGMPEILIVTLSTTEGQLPAGSFVVRIRVTVPATTSAGLGV